MVMRVDIPTDIQLEIQQCETRKCFYEVCSRYDLNAEQINILEESWMNETSIKKEKKDASHEKGDIYEHYLSYLSSTMGNSTMHAIHNNIVTTWTRLNIRMEKDKNSNYGLVVGRIQSGKTAHMIGLGLKALQGDEIGECYDTIIILSGTIEDLRLQTMERLEEIGYLDEQVRCVPKKRDLTYDTDAVEEISHHLRHPTPGKMVIVIKKNVDVLDQMNGILNDKTVRHGLRKRKVMIIDDECDYASMDGNNAEDSDGTTNPDEITRTNKAIRTMLIHLRKSASPSWYIGYTATPYANVLMQENSSTEDSEFGLSLFPRNFIHSLPKPNDHLDNEQYFLTPNRNVVLLDDPAVKRIHTTRNFLYLHVLSREIKFVRGISEYPHISLIHTDSETIEHKRMRKEMETQIENVITKERDFIHKVLETHLRVYYPKLLKSQMEAVLQQIKAYPDAKFDRMFSDCQVIELNRRKKEKKYDGEGNLIKDEEYYLPQEIMYAKPNLSAIVVGGSRVSRGLTLKGLTNTWFTRTARLPNYDTMLQMARWCGYRKVNEINYNDLVRIFTTTNIAQGFSTIAGVEQALRTQLEAFSHKTDPVEESVWIQSHEGFRITGRMPSRLGESRMFGDIWLSKIWSHQPPIFGHEPGTEPNKALFESFWKFYLFGMKKKHGESPYHGGYQLAEDKVKAAHVLRFLKMYMACYPESSNNDTKQKLSLVIKRIEEEKSAALKNWNVALRQTKTKQKFNYMKTEFGLVDRVFNSFGHAKIIQSDDKSHIADIGEVDRNNPLLLIYLANQDYKTDGERVFPPNLDFPIPLLGIILPEESLGSGGHLVQRFR